MGDEREEGRFLDAADLAEEEGESGEDSADICKIVTVSLDAKTLVHPAPVPAGRRSRMSVTQNETHVRPSRSYRYA